MYELTKSCLFMIGLFMITLALFLLLPPQIQFHSLEHALFAVIK